MKRPAGQALLDDIAERVKRVSQIPLSKMVDVELQPVKEHRSSSRRVSTIHGTIKAGVERTVLAHRVHHH